MNKDSLQFYPTPQFNKIIELFATDGLYGVAYSDIKNADISFYCKDPYYSKLSENIKTNVFETTYYNIPNVEATWFINRPYGNILDYEYFSKWVKTRKGQIILCGDERNKFFEFKPLISGSSELLWSNYPLKFSAGQTSLF